MSSKRKRKLKPLSAKLISWWHPSLNGDVRPECVSGGSERAIWFLHYDEKWKQWHEWDATPKSMSRGENCPICTGHRLVVGINDLTTRNPTVAGIWHPTLNGALTPQMVTEHSDTTVWWQHYHEQTVTWHEWPMPVSKLTSKKPQSCSVCNGRRVQVGVNDLATTHSNLVLEWHPILNGVLTPQMITKGNEEEIWWQKDCFKNGITHDWHATSNNRTGKNPQGCAICNGRQVQIGVNDLASQYPTLALEWDRAKNKKLTPQMVTVGSNQKVFWKHKTRNGLEHGWLATVVHRTGPDQTGCPECNGGGFDPALPAHVYVLSATIQESQVIQFGISNNMQSRLTTHARSGFTNKPVKLISFDKGADARALEVSLLDLLKDCHIPTATQRGIKFDGSTEAFCVEDAIDNEDFLDEFQALVGLG